jgi:hypothetical protein
MKLKTYLQNLIPSSFTDWLKVSIGIAFLVQIFLSNQLWYSTARTYPFVPLIGQNSFFTTFLIQSICFILLIISNLGLIFFSKKRISTIFFLSILGLYFLQDMVSLQAWSYQYFMMILVIFIGGFYKKSNSNTILALQLIISFTYIWSGINKVNIIFPEVVFSWMMESYNLLKPLGEIIWLGYFVAAFEILLGIGLLFRRFRSIFAWLSVLFHASIVALLVGLDWNQVVYPWNFAMIAFNFILFYKKENEVATAWNTFFKQKTTSISLTIIVLLFGIAPLFSFFGWYDDQLSLKMYSGTSSDCIIYFESTDLNCFEKVADSDVYYDELTQKMELSIDNWALEELKTPGYAGFWYYKKLAKQAFKCVEADKAGIQLTKVHSWDWEETKYRLSYDEL